MREHCGFSGMQDTKLWSDAGDEWDEDEVYFVAEELKEYFPEMQFKEISYCAGVLCF